MLAVLDIVKVSHLRLKIHVQIATFILEHVCE